MIKQHQQQEGCLWIAVPLRDTQKVNCSLCHQMTRCKSSCLRSCLDPFIIRPKQQALCQATCQSQSNLGLARNISALSQGTISHVPGGYTLSHVQRPKDSQAALQFGLTATHRCSKDNLKLAARHIRAPMHCIQCRNPSLQTYSEMHFSLAGLVALYTQEPIKGCSRSQWIPAADLSKDGKSGVQG